MTGLRASGRSQRLRVTRGGQPTGGAAPQRHRHPVAPFTASTPTPVSTIMTVKALGTPTMQQLLRVAAVVAVLFGVLLMHSSPLLDHSAAHPTSSGHDSGAHAHSHDAATAPMTLGDLPVVLAGTGCEGKDCSDHTGLHLCMAVMTIAAALVLARWYATATTGEAAVHSLRALLRHRAGRAPPWTTPTLAQLSVLRV